MKKKPEDQMIEYMKKQYQMITSVPVFCSSCGQEILWMPGVPRHVYEQEIGLKMHSDCLRKTLEQMRQR